MGASGTRLKDVTRDIDFQYYEKYVGRHVDGITVVRASVLRYHSFTLGEYGTVKDNQRKR
jgi:hypothetical protein